MLALPQTPHALLVRKLRRRSRSQCQAGPQRDVGDVADLVVACVVMSALLAIADLIDAMSAGAGDDALADQEAGREVDVVAGCPHGQADGLTADPDAEWLLGGQQVGTLAAPARLDGDPRCPLRPAAGHVPSSRACLQVAVRSPHCPVLIRYPALPSQATSVWIGAWRPTVPRSAQPGSRTGRSTGS